MRVHVAASRDGSCGSRHRYITHTHTHIEEHDLPWTCVYGLCFHQPAAKDKHTCWWCQRSGFILLPVLKQWCNRVDEIKGSRWNGLTCVIFSSRVISKVQMQAIKSFFLLSSHVLATVRSHQFVFPGPRKVKNGKKRKHRKQAVAAQINKDIQ